MPDYQQGKIYTIRCRTDDTMIYVGSTTQSLAKRWGGHKVHSREEKQKNRLIYTIINNDWDNWHIELYESYPCSCREELCRKEGEVIRLIGNLNSKIEGRTQQEISEYAKAYHQDHKQELSENKKEYYQNHKQEHLEKQKAYRQDHKQEISEYRKKILTCICGCNLTKHNLNKHLKSKKHCDLMVQASPPQAQAQAQEQDVGRP